MIKKDIVSAIATAVDVPQETASNAVNTILKEFVDSLVEGARIEIRGFGSFHTVVRKSSVGRDIQRDTPVIIPEFATVKFKPGNYLRVIGRIDERYGASSRARLQPH